jgi:hypothetical protein
MARPIPLLAPVTFATLSCYCLVICFCPSIAAVSPDQTQRKSDETP